LFFHFKKKNLKTLGRFGLRRGELTNIKNTQNEQSKQLSINYKK